MGKGVSNGSLDWGGGRGGGNKRPDFWSCREVTNKLCDLGQDLSPSSLSLPICGIEEIALDVSEDAPSSSHAPAQGGWHGPMRLLCNYHIDAMGTSRGTGASCLMGILNVPLTLHETFGKSLNLSAPQGPMSKMGWLPYAQPILTSPGKGQARPLTCSVKFK